MIDVSAYPICVVFHGLKVWIFGVLDVPDPDYGISARGVEALQVRIVLERVDPGPVTSFPFVTDHKRHLTTTTTRRKRRKTL